MIQSEKTYNLEKRTTEFGVLIVRFCKDIAETVITKPVISQLVRSATSIGANYREANGASSKKDFTNKIFICKKETQETKHWLTIIVECIPEKELEIKKLWQEAHELNLIFQKIATTSRANS